MNKLREIWKKLTLCYTGDKRLIEELWKEIEEAYTSPGRHYHDPGHLEYMVNKALEYKDKLNDPDTILFSIFYHDFIYDPARHDNEERSAEIAKDRMARLGVPSEKISRSENQILATKIHEAAADPDTGYFSDMDLAVLGEEPDSYQDYADKIRKEYSIYPDFLYRKGRKKVLRYFLDKERIFKTKDFYRKYEQQARENLKNELKKL